MSLTWLGDASAIARVLRDVPERRQVWRLARMLAEAHRARAHVRSLGRAHPLYGDGSLMAVALRRRPPPEPPLSDQGYCRALALVLLHLSAHGGAIGGSKRSALPHILGHAVRKEPPCPSARSTCCASTLSGTAS